jgi:hypothetical protein
MFASAAVLGQHHVGPRRNSPAPPVGEMPNGLA